MTCGIGKNDDDGDSQHVRSCERPGSLQGLGVGPIGHARLGMAPADSGDSPFWHARSEGGVPIFRGI
jgi:hypothetical protein